MVRENRASNQTTVKKNLKLNFVGELDKILNLKSQRYSEGGNPGFSQTETNMAKTVRGKFTTIAERESKDNSILSDNNNVFQQLHHMNTGSDTTIS